MKKSMISLAILASVVSANTVALGAINNSPTSAVTSSATKNQQNLVIYKYATNDLNNISSEDPTIFDNPSVGPNGVLERMPSTNIETKYGNMNIKMDNNGYIVTNTSNSNAPILYIGGVNNIYRINGQVDLKSLLTPVLYNSSGKKINGTIVFPNVDTSKANYGEKYIEAIGENGAITISPFIYNTVDFKNPIVVKSESDIKSLTPKDILNGPDDNLHAYIAQYKPGDKDIIIGISRGMASVREEVPIQIGLIPAKPEKNQNKQIVENKQMNEKITNSYKMPILIKVLTSRITYFVVGAILIALIAFLCF